MGYNPHDIVGGEAPFKMPEATTKSSRGSAWPIRSAALAVLACTVLAGCGGGSVLSSLPSTSGITSRFSQLFGSRSQEAGTPVAAQGQPQSELSCPGVSIRAGASTLRIGLQPGEVQSPTELRFQVTVTRTARDCNLAGGQITARIGIEGRIIVGPAGAPSQVDIPMRVAVVEEAVQEKIVFTKAYRTTVPIPPGETSIAFSFVAEDVVYASPPPSASDYVFYIGFDPAGLRPEPRRGNPKRK